MLYCEENASILKLSQHIEGSLKIEFGGKSNNMATGKSMNRSKKEVTRKLTCYFSVECLEHHLGF